MRVWALAFLFVAVTVSAAEAAEKATPVKPTEVRVSVANRSQKALGLKPLPAAAGWRLDLTADVDAADIIDLTPGTPARTISLSIIGRALRFDRMRFVAGHVYRVQLKSSGKPASLTFVYLYPEATAEPRRRGTERVKFAPGEKATEDNTPLAVDKGAL
jgi:hypothetical protein